jgi:hypothetical protein
MRKNSSVKSPRPENHRCNKYNAPSNRRTTALTRFALPSFCVSSEHEFNYSCCRTCSAQQSTGKVLSCRPGNSASYHRNLPNGLNICRVGYVEDRERFPMIPLEIQNGLCLMSVKQVHGFTPTSRHFWKIGWRLHKNGFGRSRCYSSFWVHPVCDSAKRSDLRSINVCAKR